ncbi:MAG TPA: DUF1963 domain-containing protein [Pirellulaceae bacterium]|nr:DUF1963 domain-containing protein [Pirellulaceae bacterium]
MRRLRLPESLTVNSYLHEVGFEATSNGLRQLYADGPRHLIFADGYLDERAGWQDHPTWHLPENAPATQIDIGGDGNTNCGHCGGRTHRLVRFAHVDHLPFVMGVESLSIETCLSCLGWEDPRVMFYRHSDNGLPTCLAEHGGPPQFPAVALQQTTVQMVDMGPRWHWQYWGATNSVENLHRIGGHPTWIQSAEYPQCPGCHSTMCFLLQLDSNLPTMDEGDWLWGSGGIVYVFWCTACRISAMLWQCT